MEKTVFISMPIEDLQTVIIDCVNSCLNSNKELAKEPAADLVQWFDLKELCNYLPDKPKKSTVYGWVHAGLIPCHKGQKKLRFLKAEIDQWLAAGKRKTWSEIAIEADNYLQSRKRR